MRGRALGAASLGTGLLVASAALGGKADVVAASAACEDRVCAFTVTVRHADTGRPHHADRWEILTPDSEVIATRVLHHPHVAEQPFTRKLYDVRIPLDLHEVRIRAHDSRHGFGGAERTVAIER